MQSPMTDTWNDGTPLTSCGQELCQYWTGNGCYCAVTGIDGQGRIA